MREVSVCVALPAFWPSPAFGLPSPGEESTAEWAYFGTKSTGELLLWLWVPSPLSIFAITKYR